MKVSIVTRLVLLFSSLVLLDACGKKDAAATTEKKASGPGAVAPPVATERNNSVFAAFHAKTDAKTLAAAEKEVRRLADRRPEDLVELMRTERLFGDPKWFNLAVDALTDAQRQVNYSDRFPGLELRAQYLRAYLRNLAAKGEWKLAEAALPPSNGSLRSELSRILYHEMAGRDFAQMLDQWQRLSYGNPAIRQDMEGAMVEAVTAAKAGKEELLHQILGLSNLGQPAIHELARQWFALQPDGDDDDWHTRVAEYPTGERTRAEMDAAVGGLRVAQNPDSAVAAGWLAGMNDPDARASFCVNATETLVNANLNEALRFVATLTEGEEIEVATRTLLLSWKELDADAAREWVDHLPEDSIRSRVAARILAPNPPDEAGR